MAGRNLREDVREVAAFDRCKLELEPGQEHGKPLFQLPSHKHLDFLVLDLGLMSLLFDCLPTRPPINKVINTKKCPSMELLSCDTLASAANDTDPIHNPRAAPWTIRVGMGKVDRVDGKQPHVTAQTNFKEHSTSLRILNPKNSQHQSTLALKAGSLPEESCLFALLLPCLLSDLRVLRFWTTLC